MAVSNDIDPRILALFYREYGADPVSGHLPAPSPEPSTLLRFSRHYTVLRSLPNGTRQALERRCRRSLPAIALLLTLGPAPGWAATIRVAAAVPPAIDNDGKCSLIEAIVNANDDQRTHADCVAGSGTDRVLLPWRSLQQLAAADVIPPIRSTIVMDGRHSTINRAVESEVDFLRVDANGALTLRKTTVSGATAMPPQAFYTIAGVRNDGGWLLLDQSSVVDIPGGPGVDNRGGTATLRRSTISGNGIAETFYGAGGIFNSGTMRLINSLVTRNGDPFSGGGIHNDGKLLVLNSTISDNAVTYEGTAGGILNRGDLTLVGSTVSGNRAYFGGGINNSTGAVAKIIRSTISGNRATMVYHYGSGGGIGNRGTLRVINSTVSGNRADYGGGISSGGTLNQVPIDSSVVIVSSTVADNLAEVEGGGLLLYSGTGRLRRSLVSGNRTLPLPNFPSPGAEINSQPLYHYTSGIVTGDDYNVVGQSGDAGSVGFSPTGTDRIPDVAANAVLLPLADNGGGTQTHALAPDSPALDASPDDAGCLAADQRGNPRPQGSTCDVGAFEGVAVLCQGILTTMVGTAGSDTLTGTAANDVIAGLGGNDRIFGLDGDDVICAGAGADRVWGDDGGDHILGESGNDTLFGGAGEDSLDGGFGFDRCDGGADTDAATDCDVTSGIP